MSVNAEILNSDAIKKAIAEKYPRSHFQNDCAGGTVLVSIKGIPVYTGTFGLADIRKKIPLTKHHSFHLASVGKQFTAVALLMLTERSKLDLNDPVSRHIPQLRHYGDDFTILNLLHHTSGIPDYYDDEKLNNALIRYSSRPSNTDALKILAEQKGPLTAPGEIFQYSNSGYDLLGLLTEQISGIPFPVFLKKNIFSPIGMKNTFSLPCKNKRRSSAVALSYVRTAHGIEYCPEDPLDNIYGSGSVYSTIEDMLIYDHALTGNRLIKPDSFTQLFASGLLNNGEETGYGFGWFIDEQCGEKYWSHTGSWLGFDTAYLHFPGRGLSVIVLLNYDFAETDAGEMALYLAGIIAEHQ